MKKETLEKWLNQLEGMIATLDQAVVIGGRTQKEAQACELLKDARLKFVEVIEEQDHTHPAMNKNTFLYQALEDIDGFDGVLLPQDFSDFIVGRDGSCPYSVDELEVWLNDESELPAS